MGWRADLRTASFRGIECLYDSAEDERGRRLIVHEYPQRDVADIEDNGRRVRRYSLNFYLLASALGSTYWARRDALIAALEKDGPGTLVHPYYGAVDVHVDRFSPSYSTRQGGYVAFACSFVEAASAREPQRRVRTDALLRESADRLLGKINADFLSAWTLDQAPGFVRESAVAVLDGARGALGVKQSGYDSLLGLRADISGGLRDAQAVFAMLASGRGVLSDAGLSRTRKARAFTDRPPARIGTTPSTRTQSDNENAVVSVVGAVTLSAAADVVSRTVFASVDEATAARDGLLDQLDAMTLTASDPVFNALRDTRAALVADIRARGAGLPNVATITPDDTQPALVIAHRLYGNAERASDIVARNRLQHPGFVPGGRPLDVLTDAA